jgi:hypothetical protein
MMGIRINQSKWTTKGFEHCENMVVDSIFFGGGTNKVLTIGITAHPSAIRGRRIALRSPGAVLYSLKPI